MNKSIICFILCGMFLFSCKKDKKTPDQPQPPQSKERQLTFTINGFSQSTGPVTNSANKKVDVNSIQDASMLTYVLLDSTNTAVKVVNQLSTDATFGTFTDKVLPGTYHIAFLASELPGNTTLTASKLTYQGNGRFYYGPPKATGVTALQWRDLLFSKTKIVVADHDLSQNFTLTRIVAKIELDVKDVMPSAVNGLSLTFAERYPFFSVITGQFMPTEVYNVTSGYALSETPGTTSGKISAFTGSIYQSLPVVVLAYNVTPPSTVQNIVIKKTLSVTCQSNKLTSISGYLFNNNGAFNISVGDWNPSETIPF